MGADLILFAAILASLLAAIAVVDARSQRIPDPLNVGLLLAGLGFQARATGELPIMPLVFAACAALMFLAVRQLHFWATGVIGLGLGDVKMAGAGAAWFSPQLFPVFLFTASFCALFYALATALRKDPAGRLRRIPFGPFLGVGIAAAFGLENFWA